MEGRQNLENIPDEVFRKKIFLSLVVPLLLVIILWLVRFVESQLGVSLISLGVFPLELKGIPGIFLSPLIHENISHLFNNTIPLLVLGSALFYFYSDVAFRVLGFIWLATGFLVWLAGRPAWHIGASGIVYGLASFLFLSGLIRRYFRLMAVSLLVVFLYGSMVWGMFPFINHHVSWESHMLGAVTGLVLAIIYRKEGPERPVPDWMMSDEDDSDEEYDESPEHLQGDDGLGER
ncbi:MAG: rhomboid family intramembrane serine protease [Bacteroidia bacterium]|nr:MAG: rhomboid family intramembrane serine protease [Bacteroidia bacterium]